MELFVVVGSWASDEGILKYLLCYVQTPKRSECWIDRRSIIIESGRKRMERYKTSNVSEMLMRKRIEVEEEERKKKKRREGGEYKMQEECRGGWSLKGVDLV